MNEFLFKIAKGLLYSSSSLTKVGKMEDQDTAIILKWPEVVVVLMLLLGGG